MGNCCCKRKYLSHDSQKKIALLLVGLDNAGKTTAAKGLAGDVVESTIPTVGFSAIKPKTNGYDVTIFDLGGGVQIRDIWASYFHFVHGVIYVVDASDLSRIEESKTILENLLLNEKLAGKPVLVLANKQDKPCALDEIDIVEVLQLEPLVNQQKCHTLVKVCSAVPATPTKKKADKRLISGYRGLAISVILASLKISQPNSTNNNDSINIELDEEVNVCNSWIYLLPIGKFWSLFHTLTPDTLKTSTFCLKY